MKKFFAFAALVISLFILSGCVSVSDSSPDSGVAEPGIGSDVGIKEDLGGGASSSGVGTDRSVIQTANLYLTADKPGEAADDLTKIVSDEKGFLDQRSISNDQNGEVSRVDLLVRVPAAKLEAILDEFKALGKVESLTISSSDVTLSVKDIEARISSLEVSVDRLLALLETAKTAADLVDIENALSQRQAELESLKSTLTYYKDAVALSSVYVTIAGPEVAPEDRPDDFWQGIVFGWNSLVSFFGSFIIGIGVVVPWVVGIGVPLAAIVFYGIYWSRRRNRSSK
jgi:hypothetical protein